MHNKIKYLFKFIRFVCTLLLIPAIICIALLSQNNVYLPYLSVAQNNTHLEYNELKNDKSINHKQSIISNVSPPESDVSVNNNQDDVFKIYRNKNKYKTSPNSFEFKDIISAKISGLPKNINNELIVHEINFKNKDNTNIGYSIPYIRNKKELNEKVVDYNIFDISKKSNFTISPESNYDLNNSNLNDGIKIEKVNNSMDIEFNFHFNAAVDITGLSISMDLNSSIYEKWGKIGSIQFLGKNGNVYRKDGIKLKDFVNNDNSKERRIIIDDSRDTSIYKNLPKSNIRPNLSPDFKNKGFEFVTDTYVDDSYNIPILTSVKADNIPNNLFLKIYSWNNPIYDSETNALENNYLNQNIDKFFLDVKNKNYLMNSEQIISIESPLKNNGQMLSSYPVVLKNKHLYNLSFKWKKNLTDNTYSLFAFNKNWNTGPKISHDEDGVLIIRNWNTWYAKDNSINLDLKNINIDWDFYSRNPLHIDKDEVSPFMMSHESQIPMKYITYFSGMDKNNKSIVPIFRVGREFLTYSKDVNNKDIEDKEIHFSISDSELYDMFTIYSDVSFKNSILSDFKINNLNDVIFKNIKGYMNIFNSKVKSQKYGHSILNYGINIILNGSGNTFDTTTLDLLSYLSKLNNISYIKISGKNDMPLPYSFHISDLSWIKELNNLSNIDINTSYNKNLSGPNIHLNGDIQDLFWLKNLNFLNGMDLTSFWNPNSNTNVIKDFAESSIIDYLSPKAIFKFPIKFWNQIKLKPKEEEEILKFWSIKEFDLGFKNYNPINNSFIEMHKKNVNFLPKPAIIKNSKNNKFEFKNIMVDKKEIKTSISHGKLYWNFSQAGIENEEEIKYIDKFTGEYYTNIYVYNNSIPSENIENILSLKQKKYEESPYGSIPSLENIWDVDLNSTINIDDKEYGIKMLNGKLLYNYDIAKVKYVVINNLGKIHLYTDLNKMVLKYKLENISSLNIFTIKTSKNNFDQYSQLKDNFFHMPNNNIHNLYIDGVKISQYIIYGINYYWKIPNEIDISKIKYMTDSSHYFSNFWDKNHNIIPNLTSIKSLDASAYPNEDKYYINNNGKINDVKQLKDTITIDGEKIRQILYKNNLFYDADISKIKLAIINPNDNSKKYYTSFSKLPKGYSKEYLYSVKSPITNEEHKPKQIKRIPLGEKNTFTIKIDGNVYLPLLKNGEWYWNAPMKIISNIKYVNNRGEFFTHISNNDIRFSVFSYVSPYVETKMPTKTMPNLPLSINKDSIKYLGNKYTFNGKEYDYVVFKSKIYMQHKHYIRANFFIKDENDKMEFASDLNSINSKDRSVSWSYVHAKMDSKSLLNDFNGLPLPKPKDVKEGFIWVWDHGKKKKIIIDKLENNYYYLDHNDLLGSIKWFDKSTGQYYNDYKDLSIDSKQIESVDIKDSFIETYVRSINKVFDKQIKENRKSGLIIAIASISVAFALSMVLYISKRMIIKGGK